MFRPTATILVATATLCACGATGDPRGSGGGNGTGGDATATDSLTTSPPSTISASMGDGGGTGTTTTASVDDTAGTSSAEGTGADGTTTTSEPTTSEPTTGPPDTSGTTSGGTTGGDSGPGSTDTGPAPSDHLVINEIDYDTNSLDTSGREFVEIYNGTGSDVSLSGLGLYFVNGTSATAYAPGDPVDLSSAGATLPDGAFLVVADDPTTLGISAGADLLVVDLGGGGNQLQNGAPDGLVLFDLDNGVVLDSVVYEGPPFSATVDMQTVQVGEASSAPTDPAASLTDSIGRDGNGTDTDDNGADFSVYATATPGAAN